MTEQNATSKYIKCSQCRCNYLNEETHIKANFGYNRLNEQFKTCVKCKANRARRKEQIAEYGRAYREANRDSINEKDCLVRAR